MDKCCKMVGAFFSRVTSSNSRRRDNNNPQVVDVIRAVPRNGVPAKETATGAYKAGVWVWDVPHARTSPRPHRSKHGESSKDQRKCHSMDRSAEPSKQHHHAPVCQPDGKHHQLTYPQDTNHPQLTYQPDNKHHEPKHQPDKHHKLTYQPDTKYHELKYQPDAKSDITSVTPSPPSVLDNDVKHASLLRRLQPPDTPCEKTERYMTLPRVSTKSKPGARHEVNTATRNPKVEGVPHISRDVRTSREEEVRCLAQNMVCSIESLIGNLHGIVGDLRQLVHHIDAVTDSIDVSCSPGSVTHPPPHSDAETRPEHKVAVTSTHTYTQTGQQCQASSGHVRKCEPMQTNPSHRYSYPQYRYNPLSSIPSPPSSCHTLQIPVPSSSPRQQFHKQSETRQDQLSKCNKQTGCSSAQQRPRAFSGAPFDDGRGRFFVLPVSGHSPEPSMPFIAVESPPNPAPTLFSAYREDTASQGKDSDSLPDTSLKTWKEKMEQHCGSADSLTPQIDWSYLVLTDHQVAATMEERKRSHINERKQAHINRCMDAASLPRDRSKLKLSGHSSDVRRVQKERSRLSQSGMRIKHQMGTITRIPEQGEPCDSSYDENCEMCTYMETCRSVSATRISATESVAAKQHVDVCRKGQAENRDAPNTCSVLPVTNNLGALPQVHQSIGGAALGWNTHSKALPNWPSGDLSSIGASDSDLDDLSSPFLPQHFQYPKRSSALDSSSDKNTPEADTKLTRTSSVTDTIASGGFEVRNDVEISSEGDVQGPYAGPYENAMESRLEQLTNECSDFSDVDADAGSDVLEQSLTSLEETSSAKYDRELNTWTSYTMTHIDSDDVVSECTSDVLNENLLEMVTNNPGFDDVSLNFDELGFLPLPLQGNASEPLSPSLE
ncbi:hypothetical protein ACOMHN_013083 [Nucella lapillus]